MKTIKFTFGFIFFLMLSVLFVQNVIGQGTNKNKENIAVEGYDPVAYFIEGKPMKGNKSVSVEYDGATYHFASKANARQFKKKPEKYTPQYGGFCAFGIASGSKYPINPETFKITDGKLYLFYNKDGTNTLTMWNKEEMKSKKQADEKWEKEMK